MHPSKLADRLRAIVNTPGSGTPGLHEKGPDQGVRRIVSASDQRIETVLGGAWRAHDDGSCFVVERHARPETPYGFDRISTMARRLREALANASLISGGASVRHPLVFFDLETTGLSGGAGTYAFLVGCGGFDDDGGFTTRQFLLLRHLDERHLLRVLAAELGRAGALVTFNGKSFDAPLIETRYLFHRLGWTAGDLAHLDILHQARRFWGDTGPEASCALPSLEQAILGVRRAGDVPGHEIPSRYFRFIRTGDPQPLAAVLEHNRLDLLSVAGLTARLLDLVGVGSTGARHASEALALGGVYSRCGLNGRAEEAYERALALSASQPTPSRSSIAIAAIRALALLCRRSRRYEDAAAYWGRLLDIPICPVHIAREACVALAVHHEHRLRDLATARTFALRSVEDARDQHRSAWNQARHRLARLEKKMNKFQLSRLKSQLNFQLETSDLRLES